MNIPDRDPAPSGSRFAAPRFDGVTKLGRDLPCMRCDGEAVTVALLDRGGMDIERVECEGCGLLYRRVNPV